MRVIIAGGRDFKDAEWMAECMANININIDEVVCGGAAGADTLGEGWAHAHSIPVKYFPANWSKHGRAAGPIRNGQMAKYADALLLFWDGKSRGSANMLEQAKSHGLLVISFIC